MSSIIEKNQLVELMEWDRQDPTRSSWVSPTHQYFFVGLGKIASTRIKLSLHVLEGYPILERPFPWLHARDRKGASFVPKLADLDLETAATVLTSPNWFRFCFVRNPYDRLLASYKFSMMQEMNPPSAIYNGIKDKIRHQFGYEKRSGRKGGTVSFRDFVEYVLHTQDRKMDYHWCPMQAGLRPDLIAYDFVGYFEHFERDFKYVLQRLEASKTLMTDFLKPINRSSVQQIPLAAFYDWELAERVYEYYKSDFELYGYEKNSWLFM